ncbi:hypothetical protein BDV12DRAFT_103695 [Aspergillus spectabilis]
MSSFQSHLTALLISQPAVETVSASKSRSILTLRRANRQIPTPPFQLLRSSPHLVCSPSGPRICYLRFRARCRIRLARARSALAATLGYSSSALDVTLYPGSDPTTKESNRGKSSKRPIKQLGAHNTRSLIEAITRCFDLSIRPALHQSPPIDTGFRFHDRLVPFRSSHLARTLLPYHLISLVSVQLPTLTRHMQIICMRNTRVLPCIVPAATFCFPSSFRATVAGSAH